MEKYDLNLITLFLRQMTWIVGEPFEYRVLQKGYSGSYVYQMAFPEGEAVLKIALADGDSVAIERLHRECMFYQEMATLVPLRTPKLLNTYEGREEVAILITAYQPALSPNRWQEEDFLEAARQLGELHGHFWGQSELLYRRPWLKQPARIHTKQMGIGILYCESPSYLES